jgi:hypothetical protein
MNSIFELKQLVERLNETLSHLDESQAGDLKSMLEESKKPELGLDDMIESEGEDFEQPKGVSAVEKIKVLGKPEAEESEDTETLPGEEEMSDDELNELLKKHLS